jgi:DNA polymerase-3 subunit alpha
MPDDFVSLHRHDSYSLYDGVDCAERAMDYVANMLHQGAVALTNHGNTYGLVEHHFEAKSRGLRPIHGCELYVQEGSTIKKDGIEDRKLIRHLTVLVENREGYRNLNKLSTSSFLEENHYYKPQVPLERLAEHREGLIILSGCATSTIRRYLAAEDAENAERVFKWFRDTFGDRFYAEIQHDLTEQIGRQLVGFARKYQVPLVFTNDAHYVEPEDRFVHEFILKQRTSSKGKSTDKGEQEVQAEKGYGEFHHMPSRRQAEEAIEKFLSWLPEELRLEALGNTLRIAKVCTFDMDEIKPAQMLPPIFDQSEEQLRWLVMRGMEERGLSGKRAYEARIQEELRVILNMGYSQFFLVIDNVVRFAKGQGFMLGPRGSVCGSLLAYAMGVTEVDPLKHNTMFERFLHDKKKSAPDVDLDIDARYRQKVMDYVVDHFKPYAIPIITFGRYSEAKVSNEIGKTFDLLDADRQELREAISRLHYERILVVSKEKLREFDVVKRLEKAHGEQIVRVIQKTYGAAAYIGQHPGGVCFVPGPEWEWMAKARYHDNVTTSYNMTDCERLGLLKFDFLGLTALSAIRVTLDSIKERRNQEVKLQDINLEERRVLEHFSRGHTDGIFQFETRAGREILRGKYNMDKVTKENKLVLPGIEPDSFKEIVAANAMNRPGVKLNLTDYVSGKSSHKDWGPFGDTYGAVVYQEDIVKFLRGLGLTWVDCDAFLKAIKGIKRWDPDMPQLKMAIDAIVARGRDRRRATSLVETISRYSFNRAHAVSYTLVAYWMMWLRLHFMLEFWAASLKVEPNPKRMADLERAAARDGCIVLPPHVNGPAHTGIDAHNAIQLGMATVPQVGTKAAEAIESARKRLEKEFTSLDEIRGLLPKRTLNEKVIKALQRAKALEFDTEKRQEYCWDFFTGLTTIPEEEEKTGGKKREGRTPEAAKAGAANPGA